MISTILREDRDECAVLTLNRPDKLNGLTVTMFEELKAQIDEIAGRPDAVRCVVLRGAGACFSTGHDMGDLTSGERLPHPNFQARVIESLANLPQPVIAAVHGYCYTGALELALAADFILAAQSARFADTHARWALSPIWGLSQRLPRRVGQAKALEMMYTCTPISGADAVPIGLANQCFPDAEFDTAIEAFIRRIVANSGFSQRACKRLLHETDGLPLQAGLAHEIYAGAGRGPEMADRIAAFETAKRK